MQSVILLSYPGRTWFLALQLLTCLLLHCRAHTISRDNTLPSTAQSIQYLSTLMQFDANPSNKTLRSKDRHHDLDISAPKPVFVHEPVQIYQADLAKIHSPLPIANLAKFPSPPPPIELQNTPQDSQPLSPLSSHWSPELSTFASPQTPVSPLDFPAPLNVRNKNPTTPELLDLGSPILTTKGEFINTPTDQSERAIGGAPSSFVREVDDSFHPPGSPEPDLGFDEQYKTDREWHLHDKTTSVLEPRFDRLNRKTQSIPFDLDSIREGPYSTESSGSSAPTHNKGLPQRPDCNLQHDMVQHANAQRLRSWLIGSYGCVIGIAATVAVLLATVALCQIQGLKIVPTAILLGSAPGASGVDSSLPVSKAVNAQSLTSTPTVRTTRSSLQPTHASMTRPSTAKTTAMPTRSFVDMSDRVKEREEARAFEAQVEEQCTTTVTITRTVHRVLTLADGPLSSRVPVNTATRRPDIATRRYVALFSWHKLMKRWVRDADSTALPTTSTSMPMTTACVARPMSERLLHSAFTNAAAPRV